jgi:hypothetical protein
MCRRRGRAKKHSLREKAYIVAKFSPWKETLAEKDNRNSESWPGPAGELVSLPCGGGGSGKERPSPTSSTAAADRPRVADSIAMQPQPQPQTARGSARVSFELGEFSV